MEAARFAERIAFLGAMLDFKVEERVLTWFPSASAAVNYAKNFEITESTFGSSVWAPLIGTALYVVLICLGKDVMESLPEFKMRRFSILHNLFLTALSLVMCVSAFYVGAHEMVKGGLEAIACDSARVHHKGYLLFWSYVFYLSKYWEFIDTFILILKKKDTIFLQMYHHFAVVWTMWACTTQYQTTQWACVVLNSLIHVLMYYFFTMTSLYPGIKIWWKKYLTSGQICQFFCLLAFSGLWPYYMFYQKRDCSGSFFAWGISVFLLFTLVGLFSSFYHSSYGPRSQKEMLTEPTLKAAHVPLTSGPLKKKN
jgi:fatty acid elongase 3